MTRPAPARPALVCVESRECDPQLLERLTGATRFPERLAGPAIIHTVCRAGGRLLYVTAPPMEDAERQVEYYLGLLGEGARPDRRAVEVVGLDDSSSRWLSHKILDPGNPDAARLRAGIHAFVEHERDNGSDVRLSYYEPSLPLEGLARDLGVPRDQFDAAWIPLGTKCAGRALLAEAGLAVPAGTGLCRSTVELARGVAGLVRAGYPRVVLKLDSTAYGGGLGNAVLDVSGLDPEREAGLVERIHAELPHAVLVDAKISWREFSAMIAESGAIAEEWVEDDGLASPSFQGRITPDGTVEAVSTHDQVLITGGQVYAGCSFPADAAYRAVITGLGVRVGRALRERGLRGGDYGVDFLVTGPRSDPRVLGCELNLRATGTKHPFTTVTGLLGISPTADGRLVLADGTERVYEASDALTDPRFTGLRPGRLIDAVTGSPLGYDPALGTGVVLHMMSAVVDYGKFGAVCVGRDRAEAARLMRDLRDLVTGLPR
ncbi:peptide ligase PGM1-related protein [Streptomyces sp. NPDC049577]|uniref:peptide ligase PGM1-related protein n=1 Tax=Streptomyces sp. NPDC049577 TaxID=3155153 RepID=UPI00341C2480